MYSLILLCLTATASAAPHYLITEPSPAFSLVRVVDRRPPIRVVSHGSTYYNPEQNIKRTPLRVAARHSTHNAPTTTSAQVRTATLSHTYNVPTQAPVRVASPVHTYTVPTTTSAPVRVTAPVGTYNAPNTTPAHVRVVAPVHTYNAPNTTPAPVHVAVPVHIYNAPTATYNSPSVRVGAPVVPIIRDNRLMPDGIAGEYNFEFETGDGITRSEQGEVTERGMMQKGKWSFTLPDGTPAVFTFVADKNGFQVQSDLLPVAPPMPAHALAQIEKARLEDEAEARFAASAHTRTYTDPRNTFSTPQKK